MGKTYEALKRAEKERAKAKAKEQEKVEAKQSSNVPAPTAGPPALPEAPAKEEIISSSKGARSSWLRQLMGTNGKNGKNGYRPGKNGSSHHAFEISFSLAPEVEEAYQTLGTSLLVAKNQPRIRNVMVVSSRHGEGATTTAALFAASLAKRKNERILLVEGNFRSPALEQVFAIRRNGGLAELLEGKQSLDQVVQKTEIPNLFVITCGHTSAASPLHLLDSPKVSELLETLNERFEFIVFDCPPVNVYSDACVLGTRLDAAIFVVESDVSRIEDARNAKGQLERLGVNLLGVVLNRQKQYIPSFIEAIL